MYIFLNSFVGMDDTIVIYDFIVFEKPDSVKKYNKK